MDCLFCKIINGEIPCSKVYEDDKVLAFNDINPVAPYHILVVPKKHYDSIADVSEKEMEIVAHIHSVINKIAIDKGFSDAGFRIINNCGRRSLIRKPIRSVHITTLLCFALVWQGRRSCLLAF